MFKNTGHQGERDIIAEAGRVARRETMMQGTTEHVAELVRVTAETLAHVLEDYDSLQATATALGRGSHAHRELSARAWAILRRLTGPAREHRRAPGECVCSQPAPALNGRCQTCGAFARRPLIPAPSDIRD